MKFHQRSFTGNSRRPLPELFVEDSFFCILTSWGPSSQVEPIFEFLKESYQKIFSDKDQTQLYPPIESLSPKENHLRGLLLACNDWIFKQQNLSKDYRFAYEIFLAVYEEKFLSFCQIGQPFVYLDREDWNLQPLFSVLDFSALFAFSGQRLPPLPSQLIGLKPGNACPVLSLPLQTNDRLLFLCRDYVPVDFLQISRENRKLEYLSQFLSSKEEKTPFWLAQLEF